MSDTFLKYGYSFQSKLIACLFKDKPFLQQIMDILEPDYFESEANKWMMSTIIDYYIDFKAQPTLEVMKVKLEEVGNDVLKAEVIQNLKDAVRNFDAVDLDFVKDETIKFCKNQKIKQAITQSVELLQFGDYDGIKTKIDEAMKAGGDKDIGHDYNVDIADRYVESLRKTVNIRIKSSICWITIRLSIYRYTSTKFKVPSRGCRETSKET